MPEKRTNKERLKEITEHIEQGIKEVFTSEKYADYLRTMSRFPRYSTNNRILIYAQNPKATHVAGYQAWKTKFDRHVVKGGKSITIIAPTPYKKKIEEEKLDPDTKLPMLDENGDVITEEKEIKIPMFKPIPVFDISQTEGKPLPTLAETLEGYVKNYDIFIEAIKCASPVPILFEPMDGGTDGFFNLSEQNIHLRTGMSEIQTVCAAFHEITHAKLHNTDAENPKTHSAEEIEAESVAYTVCAYYGIETDANSFGYLANYTQGKSIDDLKNSLDLIGKTADEIISDVDQHYEELMKEHESEITAEDITMPETPEVVLEPVPDSSVTVDEMTAYGYTDADMYPLTKERAMELLERDIPVYALYSDNSEAMVLDPSDIVNHDGLFGITREDWDEIKADIPVQSGILAKKQESVVFYDSKESRNIPNSDTDNPLKNAEMLLEDDYSMIDGRINNGKSALAEEPKPSVLEQLKAKESQPKTQKPPKKTKENER